MTDSIYSAFIINKSTTDVTVISESDKKYHSLPLPIEPGDVRILSTGAVVKIQEIIFTPSKIFQACKDAQYNLLRKRRQYAAEKAKKQEINASPFVNFETVKEIESLVK